MENFPFNYQLKKDKKLAYLKEQSSIARGLSIEENILAGSNFKDASILDDFIIERKEEKVIGERNIVDTIKFGGESISDENMYYLEKFNYDLGEQFI